MRLAGWPLFAGASFTPWPRRHSATCRCDGCCIRQIRQRPGIDRRFFIDCADTVTAGTASPFCIARNRSTKLSRRAVHRHSRVVHVECLFMRICHPSRYRTERVAACWTAACHALAFAMLAVTRCREATCNATWRHAHVHAHVHEQCSSSLRGLYSCISRKRDIT